MQYPALIYDGPFSDNILKITPKVNSEKIFLKVRPKNSTKYNW